MIGCPDKAEISQVIPSPKSHCPKLSCSHSGATFSDSSQLPTEWPGGQTTNTNETCHTFSVTVTIYRREILGAMLPPVRTYLRLIKFCFWMPECKGLGLSIALPRKGVSVGWQWLTQGTAVPAVAEKPLFIHTYIIEFKLTRSKSAELYQKLILPICYSSLWLVLLVTVGDQRSLWGFFCHSLSC